MEYHFHILINQAAGSGHGRKVAEKILPILKEKDYTFTLYYTDYAGHELLIAEELAKSTLVAWDETSREIFQEKPFPLLMVVGGDGTLHQVLNQFYLMGLNFPVSYIPAGSGNDFARGIGLSRDAEQAFESIVAAQEPVTINTLSYYEKISEEQGLVVNNVGIGLDAAIVNATNDSATKKALNKYNLGSLAYISSILKVLFTQKGFPIIAEINGQQQSFDKAFLCTTTNHPYFGGGVAIAPMADPYRANLDLVVVERESMFRIIRLIFQLIRKKHTKSRYFHHFNGNKLRIVSTVPQYGQADGEVMGKRPFDIEFNLHPQQIWFKKA